MDRKQAQDIIKDTFERPFNKEQFMIFAKNLLNRITESPFTYKGKFIPEAYNSHISLLERIGKYNDGENNIDILVIRLKKQTSIDRARTMQRNFIAWYLNGSRGGELKDAALVAFVSPDEVDWRFSLVKMDYRFEEGGTGKMKVKQDFTPARRWSFLVGENEKSHTAQSQLVGILADDANNPNLNDIEHAFDIETVTKEFFIKYRELFLWTKEELDKVVKSDPKIKDDFKQKGVNTVDFAKKLLGQIIFLYFLQKKGWFGVDRDDDWGEGSKNFLRELFKKRHCDYKNFFNDILEPLFYEALRIDRSYDDDYYRLFDCKIPFLNGGLFDPIGNYDWVHTDIYLPDKLFSNNIKTKEDTGTGILDVFDRYNFTVKEDEPLEKEVAIDPELLGKAYEKFNAIRPDNYEEYKKTLKSGKKGEENKFNKKFGVYYTPREIVHYMCQQSLINYLYTELNKGPVYYEKLGDPQTEMFGNEDKKGQLDFTVEHKPSPGISKEDIEKLIHTGEHVSENEKTALLKEKLIAEGKQKTTTINLALPDSIRKNAKHIDNKLKDITICDPAVGSGAFPVGMMSEIVKVRNVLSVFLDETDRHIYNFKRNCIEKTLYGVDIDPGAVEIAKLRLWLSLVVDEEDIKNIKPLPNLDYKVVCGNSLLGVEKNLFNINLFNELEQLKPIFFKETNPKKKQDYKKKIDNLILQITDGHKEFDFEVYFSEVFHEKGGFDVVIANPPYGAYIPKYMLNKIKKRLQNTLNSNSAAIFIDFAKNNFIHDNGIVTFIVPKSLLYSEKWLSLAKSLSTNVSNLVDVEKGFENVLLEQIVFVYNRYRRIHEYQALKFYENKFTNRAYIPVSLLDKYKVWLCDVSEAEIQIAEKMTKTGMFLSEFSDTVRGLPLQNKLKKKGDIPIIGGKDIQRYTFTGTKGFISNNMLTSNKKIKKLLRPKILSQNIVAHIENPIPHIKITSTVDSNGKILSVDTINNTFIEDTFFDILFILSILNSNLISWYAYRFIFGSAIRTMHFDNYYIGKIPVKKIAGTQQKVFIQIVNEILSLTKSDDYIQSQSKQSQVKKLETEIDQLVYKLYGLTQEEIKIVEDGN